MNSIEIKNKVNGINEIEIKEENEKEELKFKDFILGDGRFKLPVPHVMENGTSIEEVTIKEISGNEEEIMMKKDISNNVGLVVTSVVDGVVKELTRKEVQRMLTGNRDFCFIAACYLSFADENNENLVVSICPECKKPKIKFLTKIPELKIISTGITNDQEVKGKFPKSKKIFNSILSTGEIQEKLSRIDSDNMGVIITQAMELCVKSIEGEKYLDKRLFKNMPSKDRFGYMKEMEKYMSGVDTEFEVDCPTCGKVTARINVLDFFSVE